MNLKISQTVSGWRNLGSLATHWADSEDSDQIGRMPRLIWVLVGFVLQLLKCFDWGNKQPWLCSVWSGFNLFASLRNLLIWSLIESTHEILALFVLRKFILQIHMRSHPVGLDIWFLVWLFVYFHSSCVGTAKALARLRGCAGSPEPCWSHMW